MKLMIYLDAQRLDVVDDAGRVVKSYPVSTAANGAGEVRGSYQTPRGKHYVRAKIGAGAPLSAVFVARRPTGEVCDAAAYAAKPDRDWILTRILWLCGREPGKNRLGRVDTFARYIYLHGTPDAVDVGVPGSHGCVRMRNTDIVELFDTVPAGTDVEIVEHEHPAA
ncbi:L,D-transpeptidase [Crenobacter cavernae]|uniref:L,D-transpeptidase n=1 Tax=Crenobacter cavernae TaxID=2290923 RepID=A0ABY0FIQ9_9NEIS|nr:L,D-transpeptidase [Crenobacter cavernae]RXZ45053.1 L,D-transpeptidase [Crenobacter cavernae]